MSPTSVPPPPGARRARAATDDVRVVLLGAAEPAAGPGVEGLDEGYARTLRAVARQERTPAGVLVVHPDPEGERAAELQALAGELGVGLTLLGHVGTDREAQVDAALGQLPSGPGRWVWFLTPGAVPEPGALAALVGASRRSSRVGVVGPKLVRTDQPRLLRSMGHHLTPAGRVVDPTVRALVDQGQLDLRQDVLGVPLSGSLVDRDLLERIGGLDRAFAADGVDGLDVGWRAHLAGHRVVVAPDAVVRLDDAGLGVEDPLRTRIRTRQLALARGPAWAAPWRSLGVLLTSLAAALLLLLVKRPAEAAGEWADVRAVLAPARGWGARRRFRRARTVAPRDLAGLHEPRDAGWGATLETVGEALDPRSRRARGSGRRRASTGSADSGPVSEEFDELAGEGRAARWWSWPLVATGALTLLLTAWWARGLWAGLDPAGTGWVGGELGPGPGDGAALWSSAVDGWRGGGLGHDEPPQTWLLPLAALAAVTGLLPGAGRDTAGPALAWLLVLAPLLSVVTAYLALRRSTARRWARASLALGWGVAAPLAAATGQGRVGPVVVHVLAPLLVAGLLVVAHRGGGTRRAAAAFATALGLAAASTWVPSVLVVATAAGVLLLVLGRGGARWRGAVVLVLPWLLLLPWWGALAAHPLRLLGGAGATTATLDLPSPSALWQLLLLQPADAGAPGLPLWLAATWWLAALGGLLLPGRDGRRVAALVLGALAAVGAAQLAARTALGVMAPGHPEEGLLVTLWTGPTLSLAGAALLLAAGTTVEHLLRPGGAGRWTRPATLAAVVVLAAPLATALSTPWTAQRPALEVAGQPLPAVAVEEAYGPGAVRTLVLRPDGAGLVVDLQGAEPEPGRLQRDRTVELGTPTPRPQQVVVEGVVESLVGGAPADQAQDELLDLGVGYVLLESDDSHPAVTQLDRISGLGRVSSPSGSVLWRMVDGDPGRTRVLDEAGRGVAVLPADGPHGAASGRVDVPAGAVLAVAEPSGWAQVAQVRVDGREVAVEDPHRVPLPQGQHVVEVDLERPGLRALVLALVLGAVTAFLALPVGRTEDEPEEVP
ncbi:glycosyltransferase [uncultured Serinicoccus sp.]|uniref:glycosyltransferase n=1 Tax=uncultured Serinicoccus sp. TaxID=735514 RepID=UPI00261A52CE|nr:glycosyltransferase [uncultured Serinicoccus sp.]